MALNVAQLNILVTVQDGQAIGALEQTQTAMRETAGVAQQTGGQVQRTGAMYSNTGFRGVAAFGAINAAISQSGAPLGPLGQAFSGFNNTMMASGMLAQSTGRRIFQIGGVATGLGAVMLAAAGPQEAAMNRLDQAVRNAHGNVQAFHPEVDKLRHSGENLGFTAAEVYQGLGRLVTGFGDTRKAVQYMGVEEDLARFKHISLEQAGKELIRTNEGYGRSLKELGINITFSHTAEAGLATAKKQHATATEAVARAEEKLGEAYQKHNSGYYKKAIDDELNLKHSKENLVLAQSKLQDSTEKVAAKQKALADQSMQGADALGLVGAKVAGQADAYSHSISGLFDHYRAEITNWVADAGSKVGKTLITIGPLLSGVGGIMSAFGRNSRLAGAGANALSGGLEAAGVGAETSSTGFFALDAAIWPVTLVVLALAAAILIVYESFTHWKEIVTWARENPIFVGVALLISPLIVMLVALGVAAGYLKDHWDEVWGRIRDLTNDAASVITHAWDDIVGGWQNASASFGPSVSLFERIFLTIGATARNLWDTIVRGWGVVVGATRAAWGAVSPIFSVLGAAFNALMAGERALAAVWLLGWNLMVGSARIAWAVLSVIFSFIGGFLDSYLSGVWQRFMALVNLVWLDISTVTQYAWGVLSAVFSVLVAVLGGPVSAAFNWMASVASWAWGIASRAASAAWGTIGMVAGWISAALGWIVGAAQTVGNAIASAFSTIAGWAGWLWDQVSGPINAIVRGLGSIKSAASGIGSALGAIASGASFGLLAEGGIITSPTFALVGEAGPEVVLPLNNPRRMQEILGGLGPIGSLGGAGAPTGGFSSPGGGGTTVVMKIDVHGNVTTERELVSVVRDSLVHSGASNGGRYLGGLG